MVVVLEVMLGDGDDSGEGGGGSGEGGGGSGGGVGGDVGRWWWC